MILTINSSKLQKLHRNIWAVGFTSFFMDISSEMVINLIPLFLANVLGVKTAIIGLLDRITKVIAKMQKFLRFAGILRQGI